MINYSTHPLNPDCAPEPFYFYPLFKEGILGEWRRELFAERGDRLNIIEPSDTQPEDFEAADALTTAQRTNNDDGGLKSYEYDNLTTAQLLSSAPTQTMALSLQAQLTLPLLTINDVAIAENDAGTTDLIFTVTLSASSAQAITVNFATAANTAVGAVDYITKSGVLTFGPGVTQQTIKVQIIGDRTIEDPESFFVNLTNSTNATISDSQGKGTIQNDDYTGDFAFPDPVIAHPKIANVKSYGAKGDGVTDDTAAILQAMAENRTVYFPNGTYLVSKTLQWSDDRRLLLQGESQEYTIIKLKNQLKGFKDPANPKPVISTYEASNSTGQSFQNSIYNLTVDVGVGNTGAIGIRFLNSNQGGIRDVTIKSSDPNRAGFTGLALTKAWPGPALIENVKINGFDYGIRVNYPEYSNVFENLVLQNQRVAGIVNNGNILTIRGLTSTNSVPVIQNNDGRGIITLIDANLQGGSATKSAIEIATGTLYARNVKATGYRSAIQNGSTVVPGNSISEYVLHDIYGVFPSPQTSLNLPVQATPIITYDDLSNWVSVTTYGAIANDGIDDTTAIQSALNSGKSTIYFPGGTFIISNTLQVGGNVKMITGATYQTVLSIEDPLKSQNQPVFRFAQGNQDVVVLERFFGNYGGGAFYWVEQATTKTLVLRNFATGSGSAYRNSVSGNLFIEDVAASSWEFNEQQVWARQLNPEGNATKIVNNGGDVWILGLKTENQGTVIATLNGGRTEVLGGLIYPGGDGNNIPADQPAFINDESSLSIVGVGESRYGSVGSYTILVQEIRNGVTRNLLNTNELVRRNGGFLIPLYAGSAQVGDYLVGDANANVLDGGAGSDTLTGGGGADVFVYQTPTQGFDTITDFASDDRLQISASGFGGGLKSGVALSQTASTTGSFVTNAAPTPIGTSANFLYNTQTGIVSFDLDGTGPGAAMAIATLDGIPSLNVSQFTLVS